ncbi:MAG TPA: potassium transporter Kup [Gemmatimonadaceae bacterium]|nr:potassium transporter Kup [Gemmatimonadaceae bacterium]
MSAVGHREHPEAHPTGKRLLVLGLTALGVVYGDIGTSPLYALRECFKPEYGLDATRANVQGVLSLIVWSLLFVVSVKYIVFIMRADNRGEGGILALLALLLQRTHRTSDSRTRTVLIMLGLFGAALLYGDGIITPAVSVLSAVEGIEVATPAFAHWVVPLTLVILFGLFMFQRLGTARVGVTFGPVMLLWFAAIAILGLREIASSPAILWSLNPAHAINFFLEHNIRAFFVLGAVVLAVTGAEALYADMGHFGKRPIRLAWFAIALPCLLLNYFGQGALVLRNVDAKGSPFWMLVPQPLLIPMVVLATLAAIIASQALISGAFSLTQQSVQLGYSPRVQIIHTSRKEAGQVYIPEVNWALMVGCLVLVVAFRSSGALAAAYGIAVTGTMAITSILYAVVARSQFGWSRTHVAALTALFLLVDVAFLLANVIKVEHGGWVPLVIAIVIFTLMSTWKRGRQLLGELLARGSLPLNLFLEDVERRRPPRVPGTAVFMTSSAAGAPVVLLHHLKHNKVLHQQVVLMSVTAEEVPEIPQSQRVTLEELGHGFFRLQARYGFMESPDVEDILHCATEAGLQAKPQETSFYLGRERLIPRKKGGMRKWRKKLFVLMSRNARSATEFFNIPPNRVVELGTQLEF